MAEPLERHSLSPQAIALLICESILAVAGFIASKNDHFGLALMLIGASCLLPVAVLWMRPAMVVEFEQMRRNRRGWLRRGPRGPEVTLQSLSVRINRFVILPVMAVAGLVLVVWGLALVTR